MNVEQRGLQAHYCQRTAIGELVLVPRDPRSIYSPVSDQDGCFQAIALVRTRLGRVSRQVRKNRGLVVAGRTLGLQPMVRVSPVTIDTPILAAKRRWERYAVPVTRKVRNVATTEYSIYIDRGADGWRLIACHPGLKWPDFPRNVDDPAVAFYLHHARSFDREVDHRPYWTTLRALVSMRRQVTP